MDDKEIIKEVAELIWEEVFERRERKAKEEALMAEQAIKAMIADMARALREVSK